MSPTSVLSRLCSLAALLLAATTIAVDAAGVPESRGFMIQSWDSADGLPVSPMRSLARTPDGYLWLGSSAGLVRFDGERFVTLTTNSISALGDNRISCLWADTNGVLWIGTEAGTLCRREADTFYPVQMPARLRGVPIRSLKQAEQGGLWLGTSGQGLVCCRNGELDFSLPTNGLRRAEALSVVWDKPGHPWVISAQRLLHLEGDSWHSQATGSGDSPPTYALSPGEGGSFWITTSFGSPLVDRGGRVFQFRDGRAIRELSPYLWDQDSQRSRPTEMLQDRRGRVWVGTSGEGIFCWSDAYGWRRENLEAALGGQEVVGICEDAEGLIWVGGRSGTLIRLRERSVSSLRLPAGESGAVANSVTVGQDGTLWVGTEDAGVFRLKGGEFLQITNGLRDLHVGAVLADRRDNLWVGTLRGVYRREANQFVEVTPPRPILAAYTLFEDHLGNIWAGCDQGLLRINQEGRVKLFDAQSGLDHFYIRGLAEDAQGRLCAAVTDRGLYRLNGERFEKFGADVWPQGPLVRAVYADTDGSVWIATEGAGLFRFDREHFQRWTTADGLPGMSFTGVDADEQGNLWFSSSFGIFGCPKAALQVKDSAHGLPVEFWRLGIADGMDTKVCNGRGQPVMAHSTDGRMWVANRHAIAVFTPAEVARPRQLLAPLIEEIVADGAPCSRAPGGGVRLFSGTRRLELHFTCPELGSPKDVHFRYRLEGYDADWVDAGTRRVAYYGQLPPRDYRFLVMAGGPAGQWRQAEPALALVIVPQWWERTPVRLTGWFGGAMLLSGTVWLTARARHRRKLARLQLQNARESERRRIARDIHDALGATLTRMALLGDMAASPEAAQSHLPKVSLAAREMSQSLEAIVWAVRPENDTLRSLADYLERRTDELFEGTAVRARFTRPRELPDRMVFAEARHNVYLACKEAMNNALKHARPAVVSVQIACTADQCEISVSDDGEGFDPESARAGGNGLKNMEARMAAIGGRYELRSRKGEGTTVRLTFPIELPMAG